MISELEGKIVNPKPSDCPNPDTGDLGLAGLGPGRMLDSKPATTGDQAGQLLASVAKLPGEGDLVAVTLKPEAESRLGIKTERRSSAGLLLGALTMGGRRGRAARSVSSIVSAPQTGTLVIGRRGVVAMVPRPGGEEGAGHLHTPADPLGRPSR